MKKLIFTVASFLAIQFAFAQAPNGFKYQAVVRDASSIILTEQAVGFEITLHQGSPDGTIVYQETFTDETNPFGLVSLNIGNGTVVTGDFSTITWGDGPYFMEIALDETGGAAYETMGTSELLSVPYAMYSKYTENADDADADITNELNEGAVLSGTELSITDAGGTITTDLSSLIDDADADPTNELNEGAVLSGTELIITDAGGTITTDLSSLIDDADADATNELISLFEISEGNLEITENETVHSIALGDLSDGDWTVDEDNIYNPNDGNVGIGTTEPLSKLHVEELLDDDQIYVQRIIAENSDGVISKAAAYFEITSDISSESFAVQANAISTSDNFNIGVRSAASGSSVTNRGVQGATDGTGTSNMGTIGFSSGAGGAGTSNYGAYGFAQNSESTNMGIRGATDGAGIDRNTGIYGSAYGIHDNRNFGTEGHASGSTVINVGVNGYTAGPGTFNIGTWGTAEGAGTNNYGVYGVATGGDANNAGFFDGDVTILGDLDITGNLSKGSGTFKIDHPLDPANKYLVHSFVESPEMMNIYNGNIKTDAEGYATVELPAYFDAANKDFRYQLTVIGTFAQAIVKEKISGNSFIIQTDESNVEVSWQVTGVRNDNWSNANRVDPEEPKAEKGTYLHPELYNQPEENSVHKAAIELKNMAAPGKEEKLIVTP